MLVLTKKDGTPIAVFENYPELYQHIRNQENSKLLESHPEFGQSFWSFLVHLPERIPELINTLKKDHDVEVLREAWRQQLSVVEMCEGDFKNIRQILVTPNINIDALREDWCLDYCDAHGMSVTESDEYFKKP